MSWKLFIDDERNPPKGEWVICRNFTEVVEVVNGLGMPDHISFDHDLGEVEPSGMAIAKWLIDKDMDGNLTFSPDFTFSVHSANPPGAENIQYLMESYLSHKFATKYNAL